MIGLLNKTVTVTAKSWANSANGHPVRSSTTTTSVAAAVQTLSTNELLRHQQNESEELKALYVLAGSGITPLKTVTVDSFVFEVRSMLEDMGGRGLYEKWLIKRVVE